MTRLKCGIVADQSSKMAAKIIGSTTNVMLRSAKTNGGLNMRNPISFRYPNEESLGP